MCIRDRPPPSLCALLCDGAILKAGVGVVADLVRLEAALGLDLVTRGGVELSSVVALDPALHGMAGGGLRRLAAAVLGVTLDKAVEVRCSDWEAATLSAEQVRK